MKTKNSFKIEILSIYKTNQNKQQEILHLPDENQNRQGLLKSPEHASKAMLFLKQGYQKDSKQILENAIFKEDYKYKNVLLDKSQIVLIKFYNPRLQQL